MLHVKYENSPAIHNITFCGLTGVIFALLTAALILYTEGFVTNSWTYKKIDAAGVNLSQEKFEGLWYTCTYDQRATVEDWYTTSRVLISIGFFGVIVSFILATIYMTANRASKNVTIASLAFVSLVTVVFVLIGVIVLGSKKETDAALSWSFGVTVAAAGLTLIAGILTIVQARRSNVRLC